MERSIRVRLAAASVCWVIFLAVLPRPAFAMDDADLRRRIEDQDRQILELKQRVEAETALPLANTGATAAPLDAKAVQNIVGDYLKDHPGAGMSAGVQTGWSPSKGFYIDSAPNPTYGNWQDESKIPFELRLRGRIQADYYFYKVTDNQDHLRQRLTYPTPGTNSNGPGNPTGVAGANSTGDYSQFELKRTRVIFEGTAFDPNVRYFIMLDGTTRGIDQLAGGGPFQGLGNGGLTNPGAGPLGSGIAVTDHMVRLNAAYAAYDWRPCCGEKGCGADCCDGSYKYSPTVTFIAGKFKPFFAFEEVMSGAGEREQFVEFAMTEWFFDADEDSAQTQAGIEAKFLEDRAFLHATLNNTNETTFANRQEQRLPAIDVGGWYDVGGNWNEQKKKYDLFGDHVSDIDYSCTPVVRVGAAAYIAPLDRRSQYTNATMNRVRSIGAAPGGNTMTSLFNNPANLNAAVAPNGATMDKFDEYSYEAFWGLHWRGFSLINDWFLRNLDNFKGTKLAGGASAPIFYTSNLPNTPSVALPASGLAAPATTTFASTLFPANRGLVDYGMVLQGGYFLVPKKWEVAARWSWLRGNSGSINGNGTGTNVTVGPAGNAALGIPAGLFTAPTTVRVVNGAFSGDHAVNEYGVGLNYYWKRQLLKWQTDLSFYQGGNPAVGGASTAGFIPGVDGWMLRTQIQLAF